MPLHVGYARVSTQDQDLALQLDALQAAGCAKIYPEKARGAPRDRPPLHAALDSLRAGNPLGVWKRDRLARALRQLLETVETLHGRQIGRRSLPEAGCVPAVPALQCLLHRFGRRGRRDGPAQCNTRTEASSCPTAGMTGSL